MAVEKDPENENHKISNQKSIKFAPQSFPLLISRASLFSREEQAEAPARPACSLLSNHDS